MGLGVNQPTSTLKSALEKFANIARPIAGVIAGGTAVAIIRKGQQQLDKLRGKAEAQVARNRGDVPAETRAGVVSIFGGVPVSTIVIVGAVGLLAFFVLRK